MITHEIQNILNESSDGNTYEWFVSFSTRFECVRYTVIGILSLEVLLK